MAKGKKGGSVYSSLIGRTVYVPAEEFNQRLHWSYKGRILKKDPSRPRSMIVAFPGDSTRYFWPVDALQAWIKQGDTIGESDHNNDHEDMVSSDEPAESCITTNAKAVLTSSSHHESAPDAVEAHPSSPPPHILACQQQHQRFSDQQSSQKELHAAQALVEMQRLQRLLWQARQILHSEDDSDGEHSDGSPQTLEIQGVDAPNVNNPAAAGQTVQQAPLPSPSTPAAAKSQPQRGRHHSHYHHLTGTANDNDSSSCSWESDEDSVMCHMASHYDDEAAREPAAAAAVPGCLPLRRGLSLIADVAMGQQWQWQ